MDKQESGWTLSSISSSTMQQGQNTNKVLKLSRSSVVIAIPKSRLSAQARQGLLSILLVKKRMVRYHIGFQVAKHVGHMIGVSI